MKKSFLVYTLLLSFIIMLDTVYAEDNIEKTTEIPELTCIYSKGNKQFPIMYTQDSKGNRKVWQINKKKYADEAKNPTKTSNSWELIFDETNTSFNQRTSINYRPDDYSDGNLVKVSIAGSSKERPKTCPPCVNHTGTGPYNTKFSYYTKKEGKCKNGYTHLLDTTTSVTTIEEVNNNKILQSSELSDDEKSKLYNCNYGSINFYITDDEQKVYTSIVENTDGSVLDDKTEIKFSRDDFLHDYKTNKSGAKCPAQLYKKCTTEESGNSTITTRGTYCEWYVTSPESDKTHTIDPVPKVSESEEKDEKPQKEPINNCNDLFSSTTIDEIDKITGLIRIAVPIILIVFGIVDFFRATFSDNEDNMKKDRERFIKRIIAAIIVFIVPMFVHLVLTIANNVWGYINPETCVK